MNKKTYFPTRLIAAVNRSCRENPWAILDEERAKRPSHPEVFIEMREGMNAIIRKTAPSCRDADDARFLSRDAYHAVLAGAWRPTQDIVEFPEHVYDALLKTDLDEKIPGQAMRSFPAWSV